MLLGPRQTGKSTLLNQLNIDLSINLMHEVTYFDFVKNPAELEQRIGDKTGISVAIDQVQRLPSILNTVQYLIDDPKRRLKFYLTGSSARKLRRDGANLLPGRIHFYQLGPLVCSEAGFQLNTTEALQTGTLPGVYSEQDPEERKKTLRSYSAVYLKEEIQMESLIRDLEGFARFLSTASAFSGDFLDISKLGAASGITRQTAVRYFETLVDTLIVNRCDSFSKSAQKRLVQHPKFYFFDNGVLNALLNSFDASLDRIGKLFETLVYNQILHSSFAFDQDIRISTYRTEHGAEVDFIVETENALWAIEVKASQNVGKNDLRGFESFSRFYKKPHKKV